MTARDHHAGGPQDRSRHRPIEFRGAAFVAVDGDEPCTIDGLVDTDGGRWSRPGEPTIYLAGDPGVALAEFGRHLRPDDLEARGSLWTLRVALDDAVDLRDTADHTTLDHEQCHSMASRWRRNGMGGLIVPSVALLDRRDRFNVVLFADVLAARLTSVLQAPRLIATLGPPTER